MRLDPTLRPDGLVATAERGGPPRRRSERLLDLHATLSPVQRGQRHPSRDRCVSWAAAGGGARHRRAAPAELHDLGHPGHPSRDRCVSWAAGGCARGVRAPHHLWMRLPRLLQPGFQTNPATVTNLPWHRGAKVRGGSPRRRDAHPPRRSIRRARHRDFLAPRRRPLRRQDHELRPGRDAAHGDVRRRRARGPPPLD